MADQEENLGPLFKDIRLRHHVSLNDIIEDLLQEGIDKQIDLSFDAIQLFDQLNIGREEIVEAMVAALDRLTGEQYTPDDIGYIAYIPPPSELP